LTVRFLLDTDVISQFRKKMHPRLEAWLQSVPRDAIFTAVATIAEIQCGIGLVKNAAVASEVQKWLDGILRIGLRKLLTSG